MAEVGGVVLGAVVGAGAEPAASLVISRFALRMDLNRNHQDLMREATKLWELRDVISEEISSNRMTPEITRWMSQVEGMLTEVTGLDIKYNDRKKHPWKLYRRLRGASLSRDMAAKYVQVHGLWEEGMRIKAMLRLPMPVVGIRPAKIKYNSPLHKYVEEAVSFLEDPDIRRIGIWGIVGTGKTTIMEHLNHHENVKNMFDIVISVAIKKEWSEIGFQQQILDRLELNVGSADINKNAEIIFKELRKTKCLILLDDVCCTIELEKLIGVHDMQTCKVVLATRDLAICKDMDVDDEIQVKKLSDVEAVDMFMEKVGEYIKNFPRAVQVAQLVVKESFDDPSYNSLKFIDGEGVNDLIRKVLAKTHAFGLINHVGASSLSEFEMESLKDLFVCSIEGCNEIETIIDSTGKTESVLEILQHLHIENASKLESIWKGPVLAGSLTRLRTLVILKCRVLTKIFSNGMIQQLCKLENLRVEECDKIEEIIMKSENSELESNQLRRLKTLTLLNLPKLTSIWAHDSLEWASLERIEISKCPMLKKLPFNINNAPKLRCIHCEQEWWEALEWTNDGIKQRFNPLCAFTSSSG